MCARKTFPYNTTKNTAAQNKKLQKSYLQRCSVKKNTLIRISGGVYWYKGYLFSSENHTFSKHNIRILSTFTSSNHTIRILRFIIKCKTLQGSYGISATLIKTRNNIFIVFPNWSFTRIPWNNFHKSNWLRCVLVKRHKLQYRF